MPDIHQIIQPSPYRLCDCGCGQVFKLPASAPHKRFASTVHRNRWHAARRQGAIRLARTVEEAEPGQGHQGRDDDYHLEFEP